MFKPHELDPKLKRRSFLATIAGGAATTMSAGVLGHDDVTLDVDVEVLDMADPTDAYRLTSATVRVANTGKSRIEPGFNIVHSQLETRFFWSVQDGPRYLREGESAEYQIRAPVVTAGLPIGGSGMLSVTDKQTNRQYKQKLEIPEQDPPAILNPALRHWLKPPNETRFKPYRWVPAESAPQGETASIEETESGARVSVSELTRDEGPWGMAGLIQTARIPDELVVNATPETVVDAPKKHPAHTTGVEVGEGNHRVWIIFADVEERTVLYRGGDLSYIMVFVPATPGNRTTATIPLRELYDEYGWRLPARTKRTIDGQEYMERQAHVLGFSAVYPGTDVARAGVEFHRIGELE